MSELRERIAQQLHAKVPFDRCHPESWDELRPDARGVYCNFVEAEILSEVRAEIEKCELTNTTRW